MFFLLPLTIFLPLFLCLRSFQKLPSEVWFSLVKIVWKMQKFPQNKQWRKLRRGSYDCTDNRVNADAFSNNTAIVTVVESGQEEN